MTACGRASLLLFLPLLLSHVLPVTPLPAKKDVKRPATTQELNAIFRDDEDDDKPDGTPASEDGQMQTAQKLELQQMFGEDNEEGGNTVDSKAKDLSPVPHLQDSDLYDSWLKIQELMSGVTSAYDNEFQHYKDANNPYAWVDYYRRKRNANEDAVGIRSKRQISLDDIQRYIDELKEEDDRRDLDRYFNYRRDMDEDEEEDDDEDENEDEDEDEDERDMSINYPWYLPEPGIDLKPSWYGPEGGWDDEDEDDDEELDGPYDHGWPIPGDRWRRRKKMVVKRLGSMMKRKKKRYGREFDDWMRKRKRYDAVHGPEEWEKRFALKKRGWGRFGDEEDDEGYDTRSASRWEEIKKKKKRLFAKRWGEDDEDEDEDEDADDDEGEMRLGSGPMPEEVMRVKLETLMRLLNAIDRAKEEEDMERYDMYRRRRG